jgi:hypothetical protein
MRKGTTPTILLTLDVDTTTLRTIWVTMRQGTIELDRTGDAVTRLSDNATLSVTLTQEETLAFTSGGSVEVQLRALTADGTAVASDIATIPVDRILMGGVIT